MTVVIHNLAAAIDPSNAALAETIIALRAIVVTGVIAIKTTAITIMRGVFGKIRTFQTLGAHVTLVLHYDFHRGGSHVTSAPQNF